MGINAFFNPRTEGDQFNGLNGSVRGDHADRVITNTHDFLRAAGRDYFVKRLPAPHPLALQRLAADPATPEKDLFLKDRYWLARSSDDVVVSPKTVTDQYAILSLMDVADEIRGFTDAGWATPDGVYDRNDSLEVLSLRLDAQGQIEGNDFRHYIVIVNPHGGGGAQGKIISWRIVCENTFAAAVSAGYDFCLTHRKGRADEDSVMKERFAFAVEQWENVQQHIATLSERINVWSNISLATEDAESLTHKLFAVSDPKKMATRTANRVDRVLAAFNDPKNGTFGKSGWDWLNAVTFTTSHGETKSKVDPMDRLVRNITPNGSGFKLEQRAEKLLASLV